MTLWRPIKFGGRKMAVTVKLDEDTALALRALAKELKSDDVRSDDKIVSQSVIIKTGLNLIPEYRHVRDRLAQKETRREGDDITESK